MLGDDLKHNDSALFVRLPVKLKHKFRLYAVERRQNMSELIREYIQDSLAFEEAVNEVLKTPEGGKKDE